MKKLMILLCSFAAGVAMAEEYGDLLPEAVQDWPRQFLEAQNRPSALADENVYIVTNDVVFTGEAGESALRVAENASVCILICEGASLACHGDAADSRGGHRGAGDGREEGCDGYELRAGVLLHAVRRDRNHPASASLCELGFASGDIRPTDDGDDIWGDPLRS